MGKKNPFQNLVKFWNVPPKGRFLNFKEILCFGSASFGVSCIVNVINLYVTVGYIPTLYDMGPFGSMHATIILIIASSLALIATPIYGKMMQKTKTKLGRYKPYILILAPFVSLFGVLSLWSPDGLTQTTRTVYAYLTCVPCLFLWNLWFNTFNLFPGVFTPNQQERTDIWSPIGLVMGFAPTLMNVIKDVCAGAFGDIIAARVMGLVSVGVGMLCLIPFLKVKERVYITEEESKKENVSVMQGMKLIFKNKPLMVLCLALVLGSIRTSIDMVWHIVGRVHYAATANEGAIIFGSLSIIIGFAATPNMLLLPLLTRKFNNRTILLFWQACNVLGLGVLAIVGFQNMPIGSTSAIIITVLRFVLAFNALGSLQPLVLSELGDYQQAKTGYRLQGYIQTFGYSIPTLAANIGLLVPALVQGLIGFNPADYQIKGENMVFTPDQIAVADKYFNIATIISLVSSVLMFIALIFYTLDKKRYAKIMEELKEKSVNEEEIAAEEGDLVLFGSSDDDNDDSAVYNVSDAKRINEQIDIIEEDTAIDNVSNDNNTSLESDSGEINNGDASKDENDN